MSSKKQKEQFLNYQKTRLIGYLSDLEGNYEYFNRYIALSKVIRRLPSGELDFQHFLGGSSSKPATSGIPRDHFIHGGDVCDRWAGDLRIISDLLAFKKKYPENVHFLLGNRDVNKLRLPVALAEVVLGFKPEAFWVNNGLPDGGENFLLKDKTTKLKWVIQFKSPFFSTHSLP